MKITGGVKAGQAGWPGGRPAGRPACQPAALPAGLLGPANLSDNSKLSPDNYYGNERS